MIEKDIFFCGQPVTVSCDGQCSKAWGISSRPYIQLDDSNEDDIVFLADGELGEAPADPGTYEGGDAKPTTPEDRLNRWCVRECERCVWIDKNQYTVMNKKDWNKRQYNIPRPMAQIPVFQINIVRHKGEMDRVYLRTILPGAKAFEQMLTLQFDTTEGYAKEYVHLHFPGIPVTVMGTETS